LSPLVADLYRWWYRQLGRPDRRLLVESFILLEPYWALRTAAVPLWTVFCVEPAAAAAEQYVDQAAPPYADLGLMLFSHGVDSIGVAPIERWRALLRRAPRGRFLGVDPRAYPRDFATFARYHPAARCQPGPRWPLPAPLPLNALDAFLRETDGHYAVEWTDTVAGASPGR
jgi:hypothetical protein